METAKMEEDLIIEFMAWAMGSQVASRNHHRKAFWCLEEIVRDKPLSWDVGMKESFAVIS